jgi:hypothetical protein
MKSRADNWFQGLGLQLPSDKTNYGSMGNIEYSKDKINIKGVPFSELIEMDRLEGKLNEGTSSITALGIASDPATNPSTTNNIENFDLIGKGIKFGKNGNFNDEQESSFNNINKER